MAKNLNQGQIAEQSARRYLERRGLRFIEQNVRYRFGEIDIVMKDGSDWVFVEVKYRSPSQYGGAVNALSHAQTLRIRKAASHYIQINRIDAICRFDVVAVDPDAIQWIRDAF